MPENGENNPESSRGPARACTSYKDAKLFDKKLGNSMNTANNCNCGKAHAEVLELK